MKSDAPMYVTTVVARAGEVPGHGRPGKSLAGKGIRGSRFLASGSHVSYGHVVSRIPQLARLLDSNHSGSRQRLVFGKNETILTVHAARKCTNCVEKIDPEETNCVSAF